MVKAGLPLPGSDEPISLQRTLAQALRSLPGAVELRAFGSLTADGWDRYSDIDLEVLSVDPEASTAARLGVIEQVAPVWLEWRIHPSQSGFASTILFEGLSPFRRLDLGITPVDAPTSVVALNAQTVLWTQSAAPAISVSAAPPAPSYAPAVGTPEHAMLEQLLSATRYVKARQRGQILTAYRFASALANATFAMREARRTGDVGQLWRKTSTTSFLALDRELADDDRRALLEMFDFSTPERMDAAVLAMLRANLALHDALPGAMPFPRVIADRLLAFIADALQS